MNTLLIENLQLRVALGDAQAYAWSLEKKVLLDKIAELQPQATATASQPFEGLPARS